jgi:hypothetical protein
MSEFSFRYLWYCVTTVFASFSVASLHWISRFSLPAMLSTDSAFFDEQLAGLIGIAIQIGGEIDASSGDPIPFYDRLLPPPKITVSGLAISFLLVGVAEQRHLDRAAGQKKGPGDGESLAQDNRAFRG